MMQNGITVKGTGKTSVKPDYVVLSMSLETTEIIYEQALEAAATKIRQLNESLENVGFEKESVKTTGFYVHIEYDHKKDEKGNYYKEFQGYNVRHHLKISFDFDTKRLAKVLHVVSKCLAQPELSIMFTVKDPSAVSEELLASASKNAKKKAEILCKASGAKLGKLLSIDYYWGDLHLFSKTEFKMSDECMEMEKDSLSDVEIRPDDINVSDTVTFVWEIA